MLDRRSWYVVPLESLCEASMAILTVLTMIPVADALLSAESVTFTINLSVLSLKAIIGIPVFILASGVQHDCHAYLASLPKYTLPIHPIFQSFICPHYTAECLIYLSLAFISAPKGALINRTMFKVDHATWPVLRCKSTSSGQNFPRSHLMVKRILPIPMDYPRVVTLPTLRRPSRVS